VQHSRALAASERIVQWRLKRIVNPQAEHIAVTDRFAQAQYACLKATTLVVLHRLVDASVCHTSHVSPLAESLDQKEACAQPMFAFQLEHAVWVMEHVLDQSAPHLALLKGAFIKAMARRVRQFLARRPWERHAFQTDFASSWPKQMRRRRERIGVALAQPARTAMATELPTRANFTLAIWMAINLSTAQISQFFSQHGEQPAVLRT